ncbi:MAG: FAD-binding oxidoreductase [Pseudomonadota bacterium]
MDEAVKREPYWWEAAPPGDSAHATPLDLPQTCDVAIVGAGYTGLSAALTLARAGRNVQVFDARRPGEGASTRNGGIASGNLRPSYAQLVKTFGRERADAIDREAVAARLDLKAFVEREAIDCDYQLVGRFSGAADVRAYDRLAREADRIADRYQIEAFAVPRKEQRDHLGTDFYFGGMVRHDVGGVHPAKLHAGLLRVAQAAGAVVHGETPVLNVQARGDGMALTTGRGTLLADHVIMATNGYTDRLDGWLKRRLVPVASRIIATRPLGDNLMAQLMPRGYMCSETRALHYYYRPSPDGSRILFGGRDGAIRGGSQRAERNLRRALADIFPELDGIDITHSWYGYVAMNRDFIPRVFSRDGVRYAAGYCGSGVVWARWAGQQTARALMAAQDARADASMDALRAGPEAARKSAHVEAGAQADAALIDAAAKGESALAFRPPPLVPLYNGTPWFMPITYAYMEAKDAWSAWQRRRQNG